MYFESSVILSQKQLCGTLLRKLNQTETFFFLIKRLFIVPCTKGYAQNFYSTVFEQRSGGPTISGVISFACGDKNQGCRESYTTFLLFILYQKINKFKVETDNFPHPRVSKWYYCWRCRHKDNRIALRFRQSGGLRIPVCLHFPGRLRAHSQAELPSERKSL